MRYEYLKKPEQCPSCKSKSIARILYGFPDYSPELKSDLENGKIVLGGCCLSDDDPVWRCKVCNTAIYRKSKN